MTLHRITFLFPVILTFHNPPEHHHLFYCASSSTSSTMLFNLPHHPHPPATHDPTTILPYLQNHVGSLTILLIHPQGPPAPATNIISRQRGARSAAEIPAPAPPLDGAAVCVVGWCCCVRRWMALLCASLAGAAARVSLGGAAV